MSISRERVLDALRTVEEPELRKDLVTLNMVQNIQIEDGTVTIQLMLTTPACPLKDKIRADVERAVSQIDGVKSVRVDMDSTVPAARPMNKQAITGIKNIVAVASGKGGVGKSTVCALLALALAREGARVGLLDADIYGPSIPRMLGLLGHDPGHNEQGQILPVEWEGLRIMSIGFSANMQGSEAVIWRGPMVDKAIKTFMYHVLWGELDYLLVDLPPGTGDAQLTLCQSIPLAGVVAVTTPQEVAFVIAGKVLSMFTQMKVPSLGVIENMAYFQCGHCSEKTAVFGSGGGQEMARRMGTPLLGSLPLDPILCKDADMGALKELVDSETSLAHTIRALARDVAARVSVLNYESAGTAPVVIRS